MIELTWTDVQARVMARLGEFRGAKLWGIPRGGSIVAGLIKLQAPSDITIVTSPMTAEIIVDDLVDSGRTARQAVEKYDVPVVPLYDKHAEFGDEWVSFPWETETATQDAQSFVQRSLEHIGADVSSEGLQRTPERVVASWSEIYSGYAASSPADLLTWFEDPTDEMIVLQDIEFYSTCEHHMLPFFGAVAVGYIPEGKIIGVSKFARLVDLYARRLQVQERLTRQIGEALEEHVESVAVSVRGQHLCMMARGVKQGRTVMTTNYLTGAFRDKPEARAEFMETIR